MNALSLQGPVLSYLSATWQSSRRTGSRSISCSACRARPIRWNAYRGRQRRRLIIASVREEAHEDNMPISSSSSSSCCVAINRTILSGEIIEHPGTVLIKGDVKSGAVIRASGDIVVLGLLEGEAHAGRDGNENSTIFTWKLKSKIFSIAGCCAQDFTGVGSGFCKVAALSGDKIWIHDSNTFEFPPLQRGCSGQMSTTEMQSKQHQVWFDVDLKSIRTSSKLALFTGAYIFLVGLALLIFPERLFGAIFDLKSSIRQWIRVGAVLAMVFGVYYIGTAWGDAKGFDGAQSFYMSTVVGRVFIFLSFAWMVATGAAGLPLLAVGAVNLVGALSMLNALVKK